MHCGLEKINSGMERANSRSVQERFKRVYLGHEVVSSVRGGGRGDYMEVFGARLGCARVCKRYFRCHE